MSRHRRIILCTFTRLPDAAFEKEQLDRKNRLLAEQAELLRWTAAFFSSLPDYKPETLTSLRTNDEMAKAVRGLEGWIATAATLNDYLWAGELLILHGKAKQALSVYHEALAHIPNSDTRYPLLVGAIQDTRAQCDKRIDFVTLLPSEVLCMIFSFVACPSEQTAGDCPIDAPDHRLIRYMAVSKTWRHILMHLPKMWSSLSILNYPHLKKQLAWYAKYLPGEQVRHLHCTFTMGSDLESVFEMLMDRNCRHLESIDSTPGHRVKSDTQLSFKFVQWLLSCPLKRIKLNADHFSEEVIPCMIYGCPNLEYFECTNWYQHDYEAMVLPKSHQQVLPFPTRLRRMTLNISGSHNAQISLQNAIACCSGLKGLTLMCSQNTQLEGLLLAIMESCPQLQSMEISQVPGRMWRDNDKMLTQAFQDTLGLKYLSIEFSQALVSPETLLKLMDWCHATVEVIRFGLNEDPLADVWSQLQVLGTPRLRDVWIHSRCGVVLASMEAMGSWLQSSLQLETLVIHRVGPGTMGLFSTFLSHDNLKHLALRFGRNLETSSFGLSDFLSQVPQLSALALYDDGIVSDNILQALRKLDKLTRIQFASCGTASTQSICPLIDENGPPFLSSITISKYRDFDPDGVIRRAAGGRFICSLTPTLYN